MIYLIASIAAISGLLFGFDEGVIAGILGDLTQHFHLTEASTGFLASALPLGSLFASLVLGSVIATKLTNVVGRRTAILFAALLFTISALVAACATSLNMLIGARIVTGVAIGIAGVMTPLYIAEMVPTNVRGRMVAAYQLAITIGIMMGYFINYLFIYGVDWRMMFAAGAIPSLILLIGMWMLPESHRWLILTHQHEKAAEVLNRIHTSKHVEDDLNVMEHTYEDEGNMVTWRELLKPTVRPALIVAMMLFVLQQVSGINVVIYYAPSIFKSAGFNSHSTSIMATVGVGMVNMISTIIGMWWVENLGRRKLLYIGFTGTAITLLIISLSAHLQSESLSMITFVAVLAYIFFFAISLGPIPHIMMSEVFPIHVRNTGMGMASICNWGFNFLVVFSYPIMIDKLGMASTFWFYGACCLFGIWFTHRFVPETQGISLEDITEHLLHHKPLRDLGR